MLTNLSRSLETLGLYFVFLGEIIRSFFKRPSRFPQVLAEIEHLGVNSIMIIFLSGAAMGMIFSLDANSKKGSAMPFKTQLCLIP
jgi:ABC-type transporter Mla maintaining outer membrane lipid asymmetry permease subunit MlaE